MLDAMAGLGDMKQIKRDHMIQDKLEGREPSIIVRDRIEMFFPSEGRLSIIPEEMSQMGDFKPDESIFLNGKCSLKSYSNDSKLAIDLSMAST